MHGEQQGRISKIIKSYKGFLEYFSDAILGHPPPPARSLVTRLHIASIGYAQPSNGLSGGTVVLGVVEHGIPAGTCGWV